MSLNLIERMTLIDEAFHGLFIGEKIYISERWRSEFLARLMAEVPKEINDSAECYEWTGKRVCIDCVGRAWWTQSESAEDETEPRLLKIRTAFEGLDIHEAIELERIRRDRFLANVVAQADREGMGVPEVLMHTNNVICKGCLEAAWDKAHQVAEFPGDAGGDDAS